MRRTLPRFLTCSAAVAVTLGATACSAEEASVDASPASTTTTTVDANDVTVDSMVGLEVTAVGNVSDRLSDEAIRIDRDGLGTAEDKGEVGQDAAAEWDYDYDYDYYDYDYLTEYDADFDDGDLADEGVLVVSATGLKGLGVDDAVRVSGTVRRFDQNAIESIYDLNLADDVFDGYDDALVIVADSVKPASSAPVRTSTSSTSASPSANDQASTSGSTSSSKETS